MILFKKSRGVSAVTGLGGWDDIKDGLKQQHSAPLHADVRCHLSGSSAIQPLAASEDSCHLRYYNYDYDDMAAILVFQNNETVAMLVF